MTELLILRGAMASGKTTFANEWVAADSEHRARVNRDDIRSMVGITGGIGSNEQEQLVSKIEKASVVTYLNAGISVVIDATNMRARNNKTWMQLALDHGATYDFKTFNVDERTAIARDKIRGAMGGRMVGEDVIKAFFAKWVHPVTGNLPSSPALDTQVSVKFEPYVYTEGLPHCILVDIDGTLAHMTGRSPYDPTRYHEDIVDEVVRDVVDGWLIHQSFKPQILKPYNSTVIVMSGRDEKYRIETSDWLAKNGVTYDLLYMRSEGDVRNDAIVKNELFEKYVAGFFNIDFVLDDRDRVVKMWRAKGLKVLQAADGDF